MEIATVIVFIGALIFLAHFFSWLFSFTAIPDSLLLIVIGLALGPWLGIVTPSFFGEMGALLPAITLVIMLFESGIELRLSAIREIWSRMLALTLVSFIFAALGVGFSLWLFLGLKPLLAFMVGTMVGGTSSAMVIPLIERIKVRATSRTLLVLESAFSDVLTITATIALIDILKAREVVAGSVVVSVLVSFVVTLLFGAIVALIWSLLLERVRHLRNSIFTTPALVFILFGVVEWLGWQGPIAALAFGLTLGNIDSFKRYLRRYHPLLHWFIRPVSLSRRERSFFSEIAFLLQTFFFVYVGLTISLESGTVLGLGLLLTFLIAVLRVLAVRVTVPRSTSILDVSLMASIMPKGLAAAVLASLPFLVHLPEGVFIRDLVYTIILWSVGVTALLMFLVCKTRVGRFYALLFRGFGRRSEFPNLSSGSPPGF